MWGINQKKKQINKLRNIKQHKDYQRRRKQNDNEEVKRVKQVAMEGDQTLGVKQTMEYIDGVLYNLHLKHITLLINVTPINVIKKKKDIYEIGICK